MESPLLRAPLFELLISLGKFAFSEGSSEAKGTHLSPHVHICPLLQPSNVIVSLLLTFYFPYAIQKTKAWG